jgi:hypothetical protein
MSEETATLPYATPAPQRSSSRVWAAALIILAGLAMIMLGGCFLMGVMALVTNINPIGGGGGATGARVDVLMVVLYALAFGSFGVAAFLIVMGLKGLFRVLRG